VEEREMEAVVASAGIVMSSNEVLEDKEPGDNVVSSSSDLDFEVGSLVICTDDRKSGNHIFNKSVYFYY